MYFKDWAFKFLVITMMAATYVCLSNMPEPLAQQGRLIFYTFFALSLASASVAFSRPRNP